MTTCKESAMQDKHSIHISQDEKRSFWKVGMGFKWYHLPKDNKKIPPWEQGGLTL
jgi:hypothetical protein